MLAPSRRLFSLGTARICSRCLSSSARQPTSLRIASARRPTGLSTSNPLRTLPSCRSFTMTSRRPASAPTAAEAMEHIEQLYETASEEFQIAAEETEGNTVYASDDREAAKAEVEKLEEYYRSVVDGAGYEAGVREEVRRRAGHRVRELVNAMTALEEKAMEHD